MAWLEDKQRLFVVVAVVAQLLILAIMNYLTYRPYDQLMRALQVGYFY